MFIRGDTVPFVFKNTKASPKVDLRVISTMSCKDGSIVVKLVSDTNQNEPELFLKNVKCYA